MNDSQFSPNYAAPEAKSTQLFSLSATFTQEADCCIDTEKDINTMIIRLVDGGGGLFPVISTERWALDEGESLDSLVNMLQLLVVQMESSLSTFSLGPK